MLFDSHAHYDDEKFDTDRDALLSSLEDEGVVGIVNAGSSLASSYRSCELSKKYDSIYFTAGVHPEEAAEDMKNENWLNEIRALCKEAKCVAVGEIGLDYYWTKETADIQKECFEKQLVLASELSLPVVVHDREAHGDCLEIVRRHPEVKGVFHCFSGSVEMAKELLSLGWYLSVNGVLTFTNARKTVEVISALPTLHKDGLSRLLIETDCPYLAPVPMRGKRNHSGLMKYTAEKAAQLLGMDYEAFCLLTCDNAKRFYGIK